MSNENWYDELANLLREKGHGDDEVAKIMERVKEYDVNIQHDSVMDSIDRGQFDLDSIIKEVLGEADE